MARRRKPLPDATPPYNEPDRDDSAREYPVTSTLSRDLAERAAKFIVTQLEECALMWPLPEEGCDIARQLASVAGIGPEIEEMLAKTGRC